MKIVICYPGNRPEEYSLLNNVCRGMLFYVKDNIYKIFKFSSKIIENPLEVYKTKNYTLCFIPIFIEDELVVFASIDFLNKNIIKSTKDIVKYLSNKKMYLNKLKNTKKYAILRDSHSIVADYAFENNLIETEMEKIIKDLSSFDKNWKNNLVFCSPSNYYSIGNFQFTNDKDKSLSDEYEQTLKYFRKYKNNNKFILFGNKLRNNEQAKDRGYSNHILETAENNFIFNIYDLCKYSKKDIIKHNLNNNNLWEEQ